MNYATNFAVIANGKVTNLLWGMVYNSDEFPNAVQIDDLPVQIGDDYHDGAFWRDGVKVEKAEDESADMAEALSILGVKVDG